MWRGGSGTGGEFGFDCPGSCPLGYLNTKTKHAMRVRKEKNAKKKKKEAKDINSLVCKVECAHVSLKRLGQTVPARLCIELCEERERERKCAFV